MSGTHRKSEGSRSLGIRESDPEIEPAYVPNWDDEVPSDAQMDPDILKRVREGYSERRDRDD